MTPIRSSRFARRTAQRLLRWYPKPWRARYGVEMRALVDEMPVRWRQVADLAIGAMREWASPRAFGWPARAAATRIQNARLLKFSLWACVVEAMAHVSPGFFPADVSPFEPTFEWISIALAAAMSFRLAIACAQLLAKRKVWPLTVPEIVVWYLAILVQLVVQHVEPIASYERHPDLHVVMYHLQIYGWTSQLYLFSSRTKRLWKVQSSYLKRRNQSAIAATSPITGWDSSDKRSSDRFW